MQTKFTRILVRQGVWDYKFVRSERLGICHSAVGDLMGRKPSRIRLEIDRGEVAPTDWNSERLPRRSRNDGKGWRSASLGVHRYISVGSSFSYMYAALKDFLTDDCGLKLGELFWFRLVEIKSKTRVIPLTERGS